MYGECTDEWGHKYICGMYGGVQTYKGIEIEGCTEVWGAYRCLGDVQMNGAIKTYVGCMGVYKHTGGIEIEGCTEVWGAYSCMGDVQIYGPYRHMGGCMWAYRCTGNVQNYGEHTDVWGVQMWGIIQTPPNIQTAKHTPTCLPTTSGYYISYKI